MLPFTEGARYKAAYGGRGGGKSHFFAELIVIRCFRRKTRVVCIREVQATIRDSVRQLLVDKIHKFGLERWFDIRESEIRAPNGSLIIFRGMQNYNAENIKSLEAFDIAWVEEAQTFSDRSLRLLRPTIRVEGSELWFSWNPRHDSDAVDKFFRQHPPDDAVIVPIGWQDNPWFPDVLKAEKDHDYAADPEMAEHVWGGGYELISEAAYYARLIVAAEKDGRVGHFPFNPALPVLTGWDIGVDDYTAIWYAQIVGADRLRIVDYYETQNMGIDEIVTQALPEYLPDDLARAAALQEADRSVPYRYQRHFFPHDIGNREWGAGARTRAESAMQAGIPGKTINRGVATDPADRVEAVRRLLPVCEFLQTRNVMRGLQRLRRYSRKRNELLGTYAGPLHDENSHAADAFGELAINVPIRAPEQAKAEAPKPLPGQVMIAPPEPVGFQKRTVL